MLSIASKLTNYYCTYCKEEIYLNYSMKNLSYLPRYCKHSATTYNRAVIRNKEVKHSRSIMRSEKIPSASSTASRCNSRSNCFRWRLSSFSFLRSSYLTLSLCCSLRANSCQMHQIYKLSTHKCKNVIPNWLQEKASIHHCATRDKQWTFNLSTVNNYL